MKRTRGQRDREVGSQSGYSKIANDVTMPPKNDRIIDVRRAIFLYPIAVTTVPLCTFCCLIPPPEECTLTDFPFSQLNLPTELRVSWLSPVASNFYRGRYEVGALCVFRYDSLR